MSEKAINCVRKTENPIITFFVICFLLFLIHIKYQIQSALDYSPCIKNNI